MDDARNKKAPGKLLFPVVANAVWNLPVKWAEKAQQLAKKIEKKNVVNNVKASIDDVPNYYLTSLYLAELKERNAQISKLKMQMSRFNDDF